MPARIENNIVRVKGTVQGVGFRPAVYRLALDCQLRGQVTNDNDGVLIHISGLNENIQNFLGRLKNEAPPLSRISSISAQRVPDAWSFPDFRIAASRHIEGCTEIVADAATCQACIAEINTPGERRYLYPFTNCTHCGPRLSIIEGIPYDRASTTMKAFALCGQCRQEYDDPLDRRFHAQPIACPACGPTLSIHEYGNLSKSTAPLEQEPVQQQLHQICNALNSGKIVALKGLGGFHLCCDASNHQAVAQLRLRKQRYAKPFALMATEIADIKSYCLVNQEEEVLLKSAAAPIVLLETRADNDLVHGRVLPLLSPDIAPGSRLLGFMLPYTPLHHLVCQQFGRALVMTSGNVSGEPQIIDNAEALAMLGGIADLIVCHNRDIANRIDDSVVRYVAGKARMLRRARGYAPGSIALPKGFETADGILAYGAELKSTFCLVKKGAAILSQHQGDLEELNTFDDYEHNLKLYRALFEFQPGYRVCDQHPEYISSKLAKSNTAQLDTGSITVQHHHAHIASAMAENQIPLTHPAVLGIALDGLGMGDDGSLWGGEFLLADYCTYQRVASLKPVAIPGAGQSVRQPWRNAYAHILNSMSWENFISTYAETALANFLNQQPLATLQAMIQSRLNSPLASSTGRLFDAVAAAIGLHMDQVQFEGQAAIALENLVDKQLLAAALADKAENAAYCLRIEATGQEAPAFFLNPDSLWPALLADIRQELAPAMIATRFHAGLIRSIINMVGQLRQTHQFDDVALSGGCMQNAILLEGLEQELSKLGLNCLSHTLVPANDGGIALGQAAIAAARILQANQASLFHPT